MDAVAGFESLTRYEMTPRINYRTKETSSANKLV